jgi:hypothetical protein
MMFGCYPKTGSNWVEEMILLPKNDLDFEGAKSDLEVDKFIYFE